MNKSEKPYSLTGHLNIFIDRDVVRVKCEGQHISLTFTSSKTIQKFMRCSPIIKQALFPAHILEELNLIYYIDNILIGEQDKSLSSDLLSKSLGLKNTKFYLRNFLRYLFCSIWK